MSVGLLISISFLVKLAGYGDLATRLLITSLRIFHVCFKLDLALPSLLSFYFFLATRTRQVSLFLNDL